MNCRDWEERLALYAGGDLAPGERPEVERHLGECAGCQVFLSGVTAELQVLKEAHAEPPSEAHFAAVRARVLAKVRHDRRPWWRKGWAYGLVAAAAALLIGLVLRPGPAPAPPPMPQVAVTQPPPAVEVRPAESVRRPAGLHHKKRVQAPPPVVGPVRPLVVKLVTDDPDVVIYWITDTRGE